jgi:hypothetical protein
LVGSGTTYHLWFGPKFIYSSFVMASIEAKRRNVLDIRFEGRLDGKSSKATSSCRRGRPFLMRWPPPSWALI